MDLIKNTEKVVESGLNHAAAEFVKAVMQAQRDHRINGFDSDYEDEFVYGTVAYCVYSKELDRIVTNVMSFDANVEGLARRWGLLRIMASLDGVNEHVKKVIDSLKGYIRKGDA